MQTPSLLINLDVFQLVNVSKALELFFFVLSSMCCESFKKIVGVVFEIFEKLLKVEHLPKITMVIYHGNYHGKLPW